MKVIDNKIHGIIDYVTVAIFIITPLIFGFEGFAAILSYLLGVIHLAMTLLTNFELGYMDILEVKYHKLVEAGVGPILIILSFAFAMDNLATEAVFYVLMAAIIMIVGVLSFYTPGMPTKSEKSDVGKMEETPTSQS